MQPVRRWLVVMGAVAGMLAVSALAVALSRQETPSGRKVGTGEVGSPGRVFATDRGDPIDVDLVQGANGTRCIGISGEPYLTSRYCPPQATIESGRAYTALSPVEGEEPSVLVGFLPRGRTRVLVSLDGVSALGRTQEGLFLVILRPGALDAAGGTKLTVEFASN